MIKTTLPAKRAISEIVQAYREMQARKSHPLSLRDFAKALTEVLRPHGGSISHQSVKNWKDCKHLPNPFYMMQIEAHAPLDWRRDFAQDVLGVLCPEQYPPSTYIGELAIEQERSEGLKMQSGRPLQA